MFLFSLLLLLLVFFRTSTRCEGGRQGLRRSPRSLLAGQPRPASLIAIRRQRRPRPRALSKASWLVLLHLRRAVASKPALLLPVRAALFSFVGRMPVPSTRP